MNADDLIENWKNLHLSDEEKGTKIEFDHQLGPMIEDQLDLCLVGKLLTPRTIAPGIIKNVFANAWRTRMGFSVEGLGRNIFLFKFNSRKDKEFVFRLGPWLMDNALLALDVPKANIKISQMNFGRAAFWVHLLDIPLGFQNKFMAKRLGNAMGEFLEAECDQDNFCWGESLRVKIMIDITKPLHRGIWIEPGENVDSLWIQAKYERLPDFCYGCGRIGHVVKDCPHLSEGEKQETEPFQFGNWLRF